MAPTQTEESPLPLSIFIIAKNEADRIGGVIEAVRGLSDDIVVVDSGSTDATREVAQAAGARVVVNEPFPGYGPQKRFAEEQCRHDWLLNIDADEYVPPALAAEIRALFSAGAPPLDGYRVPIAEMFPGEAQPQRFAYTLSPVRLYRMSVGRYVTSPVHDRVGMPKDARIGSLKTAIHHRSIRSLGHQITKLNAYSDAQVEDLAARGVTIPAWRVLVEFPAAFMKAYIGRRHALRGLYGFMTAMNYAISRYLRVAKHVERRRVEALARRQEERR